MAKSGAVFVAATSVVPRVKADVLVFGLSWIGHANPGEKLEFKLEPARVVGKNQTLTIPVNLMIGWSREAIKEQIALHVDRLLDAVDNAPPKAAKE